MNNTDQRRREISMDCGHEPRVKARFLFSGMSDYWGGVSRRWDKDAGCVFAYYGTNTTIKELVDAWVTDYIEGGECNFDADISAREVEQAIVKILCAPADREYAEASDSPCGLARDYADANTDAETLDDDESPMAIILLELCEEGDK